MGRLGLLSAPLGVSLFFHAGFCDFCQVRQRFADVEQISKILKPHSTQKLFGAKKREGLDSQAYHYLNLLNWQRVAQPSTTLTNPLTPIMTPPPAVNAYPSSNPINYHAV
jgi:hypothetical protein